MSGVRTFYRVVRFNPPKIDDVTSHAAAGRQIRRLTPEVERLWDGLSVFDSEEGARRQARAFPWLGRYVARIIVPTDGDIRFERTTRTPGHFTLWGDPAVLLAAIDVVVPL